LRMANPASTRGLLLVVLTFIPKSVRVRGSGETVGWVCLVNKRIWSGRIIERGERVGEPGTFGGPETDLGGAKRGGFKDAEK